MRLHDALRPHLIWAGVVRRAQAFANSTKAMSELRKVKAHQTECSTEADEQKWARLANEWADEEAKAALQRHPQPSAAERAEVSQAWEDALATCQVLARATLLWPAASGKDRQARWNRATTRRGRLLEAQTKRARRAEERRLRAQHAWSTHAWINVGSSFRCAACLCLCTGRRHQVEPCPGPPARLAGRLDAAPALGHRIFCGFLGERDGRGALQRLYMCISCGAWTTAAVQPRCRLWAQCQGHTTEAAAQALRRVRRGLHPKPGRRPPAVHGFQPLVG